MSIIDVHTHVFPGEVVKNRARIAANDADFALLYGPPSSKMVDSTGLRDYLTREGIERAATVSFPFRDRGLLTLANDYLLELARADDRIFPLVMVDMHHERTGIAELERCIEKGARGLGEVAFYSEGFSRSQRERLDRLVAPLEEFNLIFMMHVNEQVGHQYSGKARISFTELIAFVEAHPRLTIILSHLGGGLCFYEFMPEVRKLFANVYYDLAAIPFLYSKEVYQFVGSFLPDKVLFGSDFPLLPASRYLPHLEELEEEVRTKLLYSNAEGMFERAGLG